MNIKKTLVKGRKQKTKLIEKNYKHKHKSIKSS